MKYKKSEIVKFIVFVLFIVSIIVCGILFYGKIKERFSFENIRFIVEKNKVFSYVIFVILQILQVVIFIIPGDIINATGGFVFNFILGFLLSFIGIIIGSISVFYIARLLGYRFVNKFIKKEKIDKIVRFFESNTGFLSIFIFCNLPFVPKDILMYGAGLTPLKAKRTLSMYCLSRIPGILIWTSMGANLYNRSILGIIITCVSLIIFMIIVILIKRKLDKNKIVVVKY